MGGGLLMLVGRSCRAPHFAVLRTLWPFFCLLLSMSHDTFNQIIVQVLLVLNSLDLQLCIVHFLLLALFLLHQWLSLSTQFMSPCSADSNLQARFH